MQRRNEYSGTLTLGTAAARPVSWGNSGTVTMYASWADEMNDIIAAFLTSCGVPAAYEMRSGDSYKWLYIYNIPFFAYPAGTNANYSVYISPPMTSYDYYKAKLTAHSQIATISGSTLTYRFGLNFAGLAGNGFYLRAGYYNGSSYLISSSGIGVFPCKYAANDADATAWTVLYTSGSNGYWRYNVMELTSAGKPVTANFAENEANNFVCGLPTTEPMKRDGKFPLVNVMFGKYSAKGLYLLPLNYGVTDAKNYSVEDMTEFTVADRTFLNLNLNYLTSDHGGLAIGLLRV